MLAGTDLSTPTTPDARYYGREMITAVLAGKKNLLGLTPPYD
jgi:hypothetical protein